MGESGFRVLLTGKANLRVVKALLPKSTYKLRGRVDEILPVLKHIAHQFKFQDAQRAVFRVIGVYDPVEFLKTAARRNCPSLQRFLVCPSQVQRTVQMEMQVDPCGLHVSPPDDFFISLYRGTIMQ